jgi:hypothetical protein
MGTSGKSLGCACGVKIVTLHLRDAYAEQSEEIGKADGSGHHALCARVDVNIVAAVALVDLAEARDLIQRLALAIGNSPAVLTVAGSERRFRVEHQNCKPVEIIAREIELDGTDGEQPVWPGALAADKANSVRGMRVLRKRHK